MENNRSDKGRVNNIHGRHNYSIIYHELFEKIRNDPVSIFELGLGTNNVNLASNMGANGRPGASLYGWKEYFPNGSVYGADIDKDILFNTERISTYYCDQTDPNSIYSLWNEPDLSGEFDIIVEDGLHEYDANVTFFENSIHKLKIGGYFIIEDVSVGYISLWLEKFKEWEQKYSNCSFTQIDLSIATNLDDNVLIVVHKK